MRLTDNDKHFGPFTYGKSSWNAFRLIWSSGGRGEDEYPRNSITLNAFGWVVRVNVPNLLKPYTTRHAAHWDAATVARMGRDWYETSFPKDYGFGVHEGFLQIFYGPQTHDSITTKQWSKFLPWTQWRHVRYSLYDREGKMFWEQRQRKDIRGIKAFSDQYEAQQACPKETFLIRDYDGAEIVATTYIEEREWHFGEGWFKWLSLFRRPMVKRSLDISFSSETGTEKGSWKGGTVGTSIQMLPGELHEAAMRRYCDKEHRAKYRNYRVQFVGAAPPEVCN